MAARTPTWHGVADALPVMTLVLDPQGTVIGMNEAWRRFAAEAGAPWADVDQGTVFLTVCRDAWPTGPGDADGLAAALDDALAGREREFQHEFGWVVDGSQRWYVMQVAPLSAGEGAVVCLIEMSRQYRVQERLRRRAVASDMLARQLQHINEELEQFAYITSHDLKAPLRGIANLSRWIEEDMAERITPAAHEQMEMLRGRVHRMESLINGLLQYSRVGRVFTNPELTDVGQLLAEVVELLAPPPTFRVEVEGQMPIVWCERLRLQQVFMNLIGNAIRHHDRADGRVTIGVQDAGDFWRFSVSDDGPGIPQRFHDRVFVIFQTLVPRDQKEAAGVGLSLVKKIVEEQGGSIELESEPGAGATFRFTWAKHRIEHQHVWPIDD